MKTIIGRLTIATAATALMLSTFACNEKETEVPSLTINEQTVTVDATGGIAGITYTLDNPIEGSTVNASADMEWVNTFDCSTEGTITFTVDANTSAEERSCEVTVTYNGIPEPGKFTVVQKGASSEEPDGPTFTISYEVDGTAVDMTVIPSDTDIYYYFDVVSTDELDSDTPDGIRAFCQEQLEMIMQGYESWGYSTTEAIADFCSKGEDSFRFPDLEQDCQYYGYAFAVDNNAEIASEISYSSFETGSVGQSDLVLDIQVSGITANTAVLSITPSNDDQYTFIVTYSDDFAGMADEEIVMMLIDGYWLQPVTGAISGESIDGLEPGVNYAVYAFGYQGGTATTSLFKKEFSTPTK